MNLDNIRVFVKVVELGSFTAAGKTLGIPVTTISGKVAALEESLNLTLLNRSTRRLSLTASGETVFQHGKRAIAEIEKAKEELAGAQQEPSGTLRVTASPDVAHSYVLPLVASYMAKYPKVRVDLLLTNRIVNLVGEGVDLAIRIGDLKDSTLMTTKFMNAKGAIWATPKYLKDFGRPKKLEDLTKHSTFLYTMDDQVAFKQGNEQVVLSLQSRFTADDMLAIKTMVMSGTGIGLLPEYVCYNEEKSGKLVRLFPQWSWMDIKISFVYHSQKHASPSVKSFIEWLLNEGKKK